MAHVLDPAIFDDAAVIQENKGWRQVGCGDGRGGLGTGQVSATCCGLSLSRAMTQHHIDHALSKDGLRSAYYKFLFDFLGITTMGALFTMNDNKADHEGMEWSLAALRGCAAKLREEAND